MPRRGILLLLLLSALLAGAFLVALVSQRTIEGAIPGKAPVLSFHVVDQGLLAGTGQALFLSEEGRGWARVRGLRRGPSLVTESDGAVVVLVGGRLVRSGDLRSFQPLGGRRLAGTAVAGGPGGSVFVAERGGRLVRVTLEGKVEPIEAAGAHPEQVLALAAEDRALCAAGLSTGLWCSADAGRTWRRLLQTPARAILIDPGDPQRLLLGTPGGLLVSTDGGASFRFGELRSAVEALAEHRGAFFAIADRLVLRSSNGLTGWNVPLRDRNHHFAEQFSADLQGRVHWPRGQAASPVTPRR